MKKTINYGTCEICGKVHRTTSRKVVWNGNTLDYNCVKCNLISVVFTKSELEHMLEQMNELGKTALVFGGHVEGKMFHKARKPLV